MTMYRWLLLAAVLCSRAATAEEPAPPNDFSYRELCVSFTAEDRQAAGGNGRQVVYHIKSTLPGVTPKDIQLQLRAGDITRDVVLDEQGNFSLGYEQALFDADAMLVSNQPKGSLTLTLTATIKLADMLFDVSELLSDGRVSYTSLYRVGEARRVEVANKIIATALESSVEPQQDDSEVGVIPDADGMVLVLMPHGDATTASAHLEKNRSSIFSQYFAATFPENFTSLSGEPLLGRLSNGYYIVQCSNDLLARNPELVISQAHQWKCALLSRDEMRQLQARARQKSLSRTDALR